MTYILERLSKLAKYVLLILVALSMLQIFLRIIGFEVEIPIVTEFMEMVKRMVMTIFRGLDGFLNRHGQYM